MATDFLMPKLGLTMEEGTITAWLVPDGTEVTAGTAVLAIETDKVETEVEASATGVLHQLGAVGETFACGAVIGHIGGDRPAAPSAPAAAPVVAAPAARVATAPAPVAAADAGGRRFISPNARRVAAELGVDLARVNGTGPGGRVVAADVEAVRVAAVSAGTSVSDATRTAGGAGGAAPSPFVSRPPPGRVRSAARHERGRRRRRRGSSPTCSASTSGRSSRIRTTGTSPARRSPGTCGRCCGRRVRPRSRGRWGRRRPRSAR